MKKLLSVIFTLFLICLCLTILGTETQAATTTASGTCGDNLTWTLDSNGQLTISGTGAMHDYTWDFDAPWYNYRTSITNINIKQGVTSIGDYAFYYCSSLSSITIPDSVTNIEQNAFTYCTSLSSITIPDSVTHIGYEAFFGCYSLTKIVVADGNNVYCSDDFGVLFNKNRSTLILAPSTITGSYMIPDGVTSIGESAFYSCISLTSITIPNSITSIGEEAFCNCTSLTSITIPNSVTSIGNYAFGYCDLLTRITFCGDAPTIKSDSFNEVSAVVYYPHSYHSWTEAVLQNYGGTLTWKGTHSLGEWIPTCSSRGLITVSAPVVPMWNINKARLH